MKTYLVTLEWGAGYFAQLDVPATTPDIARKRAWMAALKLGWLDLGLDEVTFTVEDEGVVYA